MTRFQLSEGGSIIDFPAISPTFSEPIDAR